MFLRNSILTGDYPNAQNQSVNAFSGLRFQGWRHSGVPPCWLDLQRSNMMLDGAGWCGWLADWFAAERGGSLHDKNTRVLEGRKGIGEKTAGRECLLSWTLQCVCVCLTGMSQAVRTHLQTPSSQSGRAYSERPPTVSLFRWCLF